MFAIDFEGWRPTHIVRLERKAYLCQHQIQDYLEYIQPLKEKLDAIEIQ